MFSTSHLDSKQDCDGKEPLAQALSLLQVALLQPPSPWATQYIERISRLRDELRHSEIDDSGSLGDPTRLANEDMLPVLEALLQQHERLTRASETSSFAIHCAEFAKSETGAQKLQDQPRHSKDRKLAQLKREHSEICEAITYFEQKNALPTESDMSDPLLESFEDFCDPKPTQSDDSSSNEAESFYCAKFSHKLSDAEFSDPVLRRSLATPVPKKEKRKTGRKNVRRAAMRARAKLESKSWIYGYSSTLVSSGLRSG